MARQRISRHSRRDALRDLVAAKKVKTQLVATQLRAQQGLTDAGHREGAADLLKALVQVQLDGCAALRWRERPVALNLRRNDPQKALFRARAQRQVGRPLLHVKCIRNDARKYYPWRSSILPHQNDSPDALEQSLDKLPREGSF